MSQQTLPDSEPDQAALREALLVLTEEGEFRASWVLSQEVIAIGRLSDNDVCINDRWISRYHARMRREGMRYVLEDLGSKNGLFVNSKRVTEPVALEDGDVIQIAPRFQLTFVDHEATAPLFLRKQGVAVDEHSRRVWVYGVELNPPLSNSQFVLLNALVNEPDRVFSRDELIAIIWPEEDPSGISDEAVNSLIRRLRERLTEIDPQYRYIFAVRGHGFRFEQP